MSIPSGDSYVNISEPYWAKFGTVGGSTFSTATISSLQSSEIIVVNMDAFFISTQLAEADEMYISSLSTKGIYLDGALLTTAGGTELLLNGIPVATTANLSTLSDWSLDPAISTLDMNANSTINGSLISSLTINAGNAFFTNIVASDISTATLTVFSTIHVISTISTVEIEAQIGLFSSINGAQFPPQSVSSFDTASVSSLTVSTINGFEFPQTIPPQMMVSTLTGPDVWVSSSKNYLDASQATANITAAGSLGGAINLRASPGYLGTSGGAVNVQAFGGNAPGGTFGAIRLTAYEGTEAGTGNVSGGLIQLQANSGGALSNATSAIKFSGGSVVSYAGAANPIGSLYGYNYVYGTIGVSLTASVTPPTFNTPGTVYLYGDQGTVVGSDLYASRIYGYWNGITTPSNVFIAGRQTLSGNSYVVLSNVSNIYMDSGAITGLDTINGSAYPPPAGDVSQWATFPAVQEVVMDGNNITNVSILSGLEISTLAGTIPDMNVSSINGALYPPSAGNVADWATFAAVQNVDMSNNVMSNASMITGTAVSTLIGTIDDMNVSSLNGSAYPPPAGDVSQWASFFAVQDVDMATHNIINGGMLTGTEVSTLAGTIPDMNVSSINGALYPPAAGDVSQWATFAAVQAVDMAGNDIQSVATLQGTLVSTISGNIDDMNVSSLNGSAYPPSGGNVADWATFPAVNNVDILFNNIMSTAGIYGTVTSIQFGNIEPGALDLKADPSQGVRVLNNDATPGLLVADTVSTTHIVTSDISTTTLYGTSTAIDMGGVVPGQMLLAYNNPLGFVQIIQQGVGAGRLDVAALTSVSSVNGVIYPPSAGNSSDWADYPAVSTVDMATFDIVNVNSVTAISSLITPIVSTNNILGNGASISLGGSANGQLNLYAGVSDRVNIMTQPSGQLGGLSASDVYLSTLNNTDINNFQMSTIIIKDYAYVPAIYSETTAINMGTPMNGDIILTVSTPSGVVQIKNDYNKKGALDVPILLNVSTINGLDVNNPYVSSISFPPLNINAGDGIIYADSGFAIVGNVASSSPALVFIISTVNTPIESISANEFLLNVPNAGASGNQLNMHVSNNEVSINVNTISGSYTPYPLGIRASNVSMSSMTVSSINNAPYSAFIQQNSVASLSSLTISSITTGFIFSDAGVISTLIAPDLHGAGYDPPGAFPASVIDSFYSITTANVSTMSLNVSTINALQLTDHDISNVGNIQIQDGITLDGAGTISLNSSTGAPGQVIGIPLDGMYPEWVTLSTVTTVNGYVGDITVSGGGGVTITNAPTQTITITTTGGVASTDGTQTDQTIVITGITAASGAILPSYVGTDCITNGIVSVVVADDSVTVNLYANPASDAVIYWQVLSF